MSDRKVNPADRRVQQRGTVRVLPLAVRAWRMDKGWSQKILAARASRTPAAQEHGVRVSPSMIAMIETGERQPSQMVAEAIAQALGQPVGVFAFIDTVQEDEVA